MISSNQHYSDDHDDADQKAGKAMQPRTVAWHANGNPRINLHTDSDLVVNFVEMIDQHENTIAMISIPLAPDKRPCLHLLDCEGRQTGTGPIVTDYLDLSPFVCSRFSALQLVLRPSREGQVDRTVLRRVCSWQLPGCPPNERV